MTTRTGKKQSLEALSKSTIQFLCCLAAVFFLGMALGRIGQPGAVNLEELVAPQVVVDVSRQQRCKKPMLGDGCYHVFLDVGANLGIHGRFLLEPEKFPLANKSHDVFNTEFGEVRDNRDFCVFEFEPNPRHKEKLLQNAEAYEAMGWRYHVIPSGVAPEDGILTFYSSKDSNQNDFRAEPRRGAKTIVNVTVINFPQWLQDNIFERDIPTTTYGPSDPISKPKLVMKMDIEHLEFKLIPEMIVTGSLCKFDFAFVEMHASSPADNELKRAWDKTLRASNACKSFRYINEDDESYALDGIPLPEPK